MIPRYAARRAGLQWRSDGRLAQTRQFCGRRLRARVVFPCSNMALDQLYEDLAGDVLSLCRLERASRAEGGIARSAEGVLTATANLCLVVPK